jgi:hypothetical protein
MEILYLFYSAESRQEEDRGVGVGRQAFNAVPVCKIRGVLDRKGLQGFQDPAARSNEEAL